jgi:hypothetical protein
MRRFRAFAFTFLMMSFIVLNSCKKNHEEPLVITPTVNPQPYTVMAYLITPTDQSFNPDYYRGVKAAMLNIQNWYKDQLGDGKTFMLNPIVIDTLSGLHSSSWYDADNGPDISTTEPIHAYYNVKYEMKQLLGANFDTVHHVYFAFVAAPFNDQTIPRGLAAEGLDNVQRISGDKPDQWRGAAAHSLGHAFGLEETPVQDTDALLSYGYKKYPNCLLRPFEKDSLNASPFFTQQ